MVRAVSMLVHIGPVLTIEVKVAPVPRALQPDVILSRY